MTDVNPGASLSFETNELINQPVDPDYLWLNLTLFGVTTVLNLSAILVLKAKENTGITTLVIWDCFVNILLTAIGTVTFSPWSILHSDALCAVFYSTLSTLGTFNRLVPIAVVLLRYIMVCHPVFFINNGRERAIWRLILVALTFLCSVVWVHQLCTSDIAYRFLRCMGREEVFR